VILQIDVTVTNPDGTTASGSVAVDVSDAEADLIRRAPGSMSLGFNPNEAMQQRSRELRWGTNRA
jgi:hypothetical protein